MATPARTWSPTQGLWRSTRPRVMLRGEAMHSHSTVLPPEVPLQDFPSRYTSTSVCKRRRPGWSKERRAAQAAGRAEREGQEGRWWKDQCRGWATKEVVGVCCKLQVHTWRIYLKLKWWHANVFKLHYIHSMDSSLRDAFGCVSDMSQCTWKGNFFGEAHVSGA